MRVLLFLVLAACAPGPVTPAERLAADPARSGAPGEAGPYRVLATHWEAQARVSDAARVDATYPDTERKGPTLVFVHGGAVPAARYQWLFDHVASRGYTVIAPAHFASLAIFESGNATIALASARRYGVASASEKVAISGHSLGGVIAAWTFGGDEQLAALAFFASYPADGAANQRGRPVLSLGGSSDRKSKPEDVIAGLRRYESPRALAFIDGMNHYAWTEDATKSELATDGPLERDLSAVRGDALRVLDTWMDAVLRDDAAARAALPSLLDAAESQP